MGIINKNTVPKMYNGWIFSAKNEIYKMKN